MVAVLGLLGGNPCRRSLTRSH